MGLTPEQLSKVTNLARRISRLLERNPDLINKYPEWAKYQLLGKSEELKKRSKNVRQQTRNLTNEERHARFNRWLRRQGMQVKESKQDRFGVGPKQDTLLYSKDRGSPEHEYSHYLMTPAGMTPRQYQKQLGQVRASPSMSEEQRRSDEATAFMMQSKLARRAGVSAQDTKNIGMLSPSQRSIHGSAAAKIIGSKIFKSEEFDIEAAIKEIREKTEKEIERETARKWAARAIASFMLAEKAESPDELFQRYTDGDSFRHEAIEHASLSEDDGVLTGIIQEKCDEARKKVDLTLLGIKQLEKIEGLFKDTGTGASPSVGVPGMSGGGIAMAELSPANNNRLIRNRFRRSKAMSC